MARRASASALRTASRTSSSRDQGAAVSRVSTSTPASSRSSRRYGPRTGRGPTRPRRRCRAAARRAGAAPAGRPAGGTGPASRCPTSRPPPGSRRRGRGRRAAPARPGAAGPPRPASASCTRVSSGSDSRTTSGATPSCSSARRAARPCGQVRNDRPSYRSTSGRGPHPHGHLGDHAVRPLAADGEPEQGRAGRGRGAAAQAQLAGRASAAPARRPCSSKRPWPVLAWPGGAGGRAAAERHLLVRLREVTEREPVRGEQRVGGGGADARLEHRRRATGSTDSSRSSRRRSSVTTAAAAAPARARRRRRPRSRRPTARRRRRARLHSARTAATCAGVGGQQHGVRGRARLARRAAGAGRGSCGRPRAAPALARSSATPSGPSSADELPPAGPPAGRPAAAGPPRADGLLGAPSPTSRSSQARACGARPGRRAGSPQPACACCAGGSGHAHTVTHAVPTSHGSRGAAAGRDRPGPARRARVRHGRRACAAPRWPTSPAGPGSAG